VSTYVAILAQNLNAGIGREIAAAAADSQASQGEDIES